MSEKQNSQNQSLELPLIHSYTRKEAITDGVLVDIEKQFPNLASQAGFKFPIALTARAFNRYVMLNPNAKKALEDPTGRMWDILWMLKIRIKLIRRTSKGKSDTVKFSFLCTVPDHEEPYTIETEPPSDECEDDDFLSLEEILAQREENRGKRLCWLKSVISPDEDGNGSITIMLPWED